MGEKEHKVYKTEFADTWKYLNEKLAYHYECFNSFDDYQRPVNNLQKEDLFSKLKNKRPSDEEKEKTKKVLNLFNIKNGEELTQLYLEVMFFNLHVFLVIF